GIEPVHSFVDKNVGYTVSYASYISWSSPTQPTPREINPKQAFNRLFRPSGPGGKAAPAFADDKSVLDTVLADSKSLRARVSLADQRKLDEFLDSVRSVETRVEAEERLAKKGRSEEHTSELQSREN